MGERLERWRTRLRSDRAENIAAVILLGPVLAAFAAWVLWQSPPIDWSAAATPVLIYAVGSLAASTALAVLLVRWRPTRLRGLRRFGRGTHWGVVGAAAAYGLLVPAAVTPAFAGAYVCERGDGILVQTSWTHDDVDGDAKRGVYTYDGKTYDLVIGSDHYLDWQVGKEVPPTADNPYYTRTYRVAWPGSDMVCAAGGDSRFGDLVAIGLMALVFATAAAASLGELGRRARRARVRRTFRPSA